VNQKNAVHDRTVCFKKLTDHDVIICRNSLTNTVNDRTSSAFRARSYPWGFEPPHITVCHHFQHFAWLKPEVSIRRSSGSMFRDFRISELRTLLNNVTYMIETVYCNMHAGHDVIIL